MWGKMGKVPAFYLPGFLTIFWALNSKFYSSFFSVQQVPARVPTLYKETRFLKSNKKGNSWSLRSLLHLFDEIRKDFLISRKNENWPVRGTDFPGKDAGTKNLKRKKKKSGEMWNKRRTVYTRAFFGFNWQIIIPRTFSNKQTKIITINWSKI